MYINYIIFGKKFSFTLNQIYMFSFINNEAGRAVFNETVSSVFVYFLGCVFCISGLTKIFNIESFSIEIAQYLDAYISTSLIGFRKLIAICVCCAEISLGFFAFFKRNRLLSSYLFLGAMSFFLYITGMNFINPPLGGRIESCGCFGELIHFTAEESFIKSLVLFALSFLNLILVKKKKAC